MPHHPLLAASLAWVTLISYTVTLNAGGILVGISPIVAVIVGYYLAKRQRLEIQRETQTKVAEVHKIVNSQRSEMMAEIEALKTLLRSHGLTTETVRP